MVRERSDPVPSRTGGASPVMTGALARLDGEAGLRATDAWPRPHANRGGDGAGAVCGPLWAVPKGQCWPRPRPRLAGSTDSGPTVTRPSWEAPRPRRLPSPTAPSRMDHSPRRSPGACPEAHRPAAWNKGNREGGPGPHPGASWGSRRGYVTGLTKTGQPKPDRTVASGRRCTGRGGPATRALPPRRQCCRDRPAGLRQVVAITGSRTALHGECAW